MRLAHLISEARRELGEKKIPPLPAAQLLSLLRRELEAWYLPTVWKTKPCPCELRWMGLLGRSDEFGDPEKHALWQGTVDEYLNQGLKAHSGDEQIALVLRGLIHCEQSTPWVKSWLAVWAERRGWFIQAEVIGKRESKWLLAPNYTERAQVLPPILWHVAPEDAVPKILRQGLLPSRATSGSKSELGHLARKYPGRIYLFSERDMAVRFLDAMLDPMGGSAVPSILKIDTLKLGKGFKLYVDPEFGGAHRGTAWWTYSPVPAHAIREA